MCDNYLIGIEVDNNQVYWMDLINRRLNIRRTDYNYLNLSLFLDSHSVRNLCVQWSAEIWMLESPDFGQFSLTLKPDAQFSEVS